MSNIPYWGVTCTLLFCPGIVNDIYDRVNLHMCSLYGDGEGVAGGEFVRGGLGGIQLELKVYHCLSGVSQIIQVENRHDFNEI